MTDKKDGGVIGPWQLHTLSISLEDVEEKWGYEVHTDKCYVLSGTVIEDPTGRWMPGYHMKSSIICKMDLDNGVVETQNTIYKLKGKIGGDIFPDLGDGIAGVFY